MSIAKPITDGSCMEMFEASIGRSFIEIYLEAYLLDFLLPLALFFEFDFKEIGGLFKFENYCSVLKVMLSFDGTFSCICTPLRVERLLLCMGTCKLSPLDERCSSFALIERCWKLSFMFETCLLTFSSGSTMFILGRICS